MASTIGPGDVGIRLTLDEQQAAQGAQRTRQALLELDRDVIKLGADIDKALAAFEKTAEATQGIRQLMQAEKEAGDAARKAGEERRKAAAVAKQAADEQRKAAQAAAQAEAEAARQAAEAKRQQEKALQDLRQGLSQVSVAAAAVAAALVVVADKSLDASKKQTSAFKGLESVAERTIGSFRDAKDAANEFANDGLTNVVSVSKAMQDFLAVGYNLDEAKELLQIGKDAAAYNRQAGLSMSDAIERFAAGVKMGNSVLADGVGITKNLTVILREQGKSEQDLQNIQSDASVRQALLNGLRKEGAIYAGNAAKATEDLAGAESRTATETFKAQAALGDALTPAMQDLHAAMLPLLQSVTTMIDSNPQMARAMFLAVAGAAALTAALTGLTVAALAANTAMGPIGWAVVGIGLAGGALAGLAVNAKASERENQRNAESAKRLGEEYERLASVLDSTSASADERKQAQSEMNRLVEEIGEIMPDVVSQWDAHGRAVAVDTERLKENTEAARENLRVKYAADLEELQDQLTSLYKQKLQLEKDVEKAASGTTVNRSPNLLGGMLPGGPPATAITAPTSLDELQKKLSETTKRIDQTAASIAKLKAQLYGDTSVPDLNAEPVYPSPTPTPPPGGGSGKMSAALSAALEDLQDVQALERSPETLRRTLERVRSILSEHGAELKQLGRDRDLIRMRDIVLPKDILQADYQAAVQALNAQEQLKQITPAQMREGLEAIQERFKTYLEQNPDASLQLQLRIKGASEEEVRAPFEAWRREFRQAESMGLFDGLEQFKVGQLRRGLALATTAGDTDSIADLIGQIRELEAAMQQANFEGRLERIARAKEQATAGQAAYLADLEKQLIDAEAGGDSAGAADIRQRMLDAVRPALEAQKTALEALLASEGLTADQRQRVEQELNRVRQDLYAQDVDAHRIAADAKAAAERDAATKRKSLIDQEAVWLRQLADGDMQALRERHQATEQVQRDRIKGLQEELAQLERQWAAEDRRDRINDLTTELASVKADTRFEKVLADGTKVFTYDEARARELEEQLAAAERDDERARMRESLQDQITAAQNELAVMQEKHRTAEAERQQFWTWIQGLDLAAFTELTTAAEQGMDEWSKVFETKLGELHSKVAAETAAINALLASVGASMSSAMAGTLALPPAPTMPASLPGSIGGSTVDASVTVQSLSLSLPNVTDAQGFAQELPTALRGAGVDLNSLIRSAKAGLRVL